MGIILSSGQFHQRNFFLNSQGFPLTRESTVYPEYVSWKWWWGLSPIAAATKPRSTYRFLITRAKQSTFLLCGARAKTSYLKKKYMYTNAIYSKLWESCFLGTSAHRFWTLLPWPEVRNRTLWRGVLQDLFDMFAARTRIAERRVLRGGWRGTHSVILVTLGGSWGILLRWFESLKWLEIY